MELQDNVTNSNPAKKRRLHCVLEFPGLVFVFFSPVLDLSHLVSTRPFYSSPEQSLLNTQTKQTKLVTMANEGTLATLDVSTTHPVNALRGGK